MTRLLLLLVSSLPAMASPAQTPATTAGDELRGRAVGEIRNRKGEPWAFAEVVLLSRPIPNDPNVGEADEVTTVTDAQGRFAVPILRGRPYTVWAWGPPTAEGRPATPVTENVFVQRPVVAREDRLLPARRVVLCALGRWPGFTFELRVVDQSANRRVFWIGVKDGTADLPFLVGADAFVEVFARKGELRTPLARQRIAAALADDVSIALPELQRSTCWVRESGSGKPCAGATVFRRLGGMLHPAGTTDAAGKLQLDRAAGSVEFPEFSTLVLAEGCGFGVFNRFRLIMSGLEPEVPEGAAPEDLFSYVDAGETVHMRVLVAGQPLTGACVWCSGLATNRPTPGSAQYDNWQRALTTDADGRVAMGGLGTHDRRAAHLVLRERDCELLPARWRSGLQPVVFAPLLGQPGTGTADDPITVDLTSMCPIELCITEEGGAPAAEVSLSFTSLVTDFTSWHRNNEAVTDHMGRLRILMPGTEPLGFRAVRGMSMLIRAFETTPGRPGDGPAKALFQLPPPTGIRGVLLERDGSPGKERTVHATHPNDKPAAWSYESQPADVLRDTKHNRMRVHVPDDSRQRLLLTSLIERRVTTDAEGRFALPLPTDAVPGLLLFTAKGGSRFSDNSISAGWSGESRDDFEWRASH